MEKRELAIRAYLGDPVARNALSDADSRHRRFLKGGILPLQPAFETAAKELIYPLMRRVRHNVELLVERLQSAGYLFYDRDYFVPASRDVPSEIDAFERETRLYVPIVFRAWVEIVGRVSFMGTHPGWPEITYNGLGGSSPAVCADPLVANWTPKYGSRAWKEWHSEPEEHRINDSFILVGRQISHTNPHVE